MKITSVESRILGYDISESWGDAEPPNVLSSAWYTCSLDTFQTDSGITGATMQGANLQDGAAMAHVLHDLYAPQLIGDDPLDGERMWQKLRRLNRHAYNLSDAVAGAIDVAMWDIRGKAAGQPIAQLLGLARKSIPAYCTAQTLNLTPESTYAEARLRKEQGYHAFKVQLWEGAVLDAPRFAAAREAVGDDYPLLEDAAGMYSFAQALSVGHVLERYGFLWFEEPIPDRFSAQLRSLTRQLSIPVLAGETQGAQEVAEGMRAGNFDIARGDVLLKQGITGLRKLAGMADLLGFDLEVHALNQPLLDVANLHVALSIENCRWSETGYHSIYERGLRNDPLKIDSHGLKHLPSGPGLGVELDMDWIDSVTIGTRRTPTL